MYNFDPTIPPQPQESLDHYIKRLRTQLKMSQQQLSSTAGIHLQSLGKLERGQTTRLNQKRKRFSHCSEYPRRIPRCRRLWTANRSCTEKQYCPGCWKGGTNPDPAWALPRAKYCLLCGTQLLRHCISCLEPITSFQHKFCPHCGTPYCPSHSKRFGNKS